MRNVFVDLWAAVRKLSESMNRLSAMLDATTQRIDEQYEISAAEPLANGAGEAKPQAKSATKHR